MKWLLLLVVLFLTLFFTPLLVNAQNVRECPAISGRGDPNRTLVLLQGLTTEANIVADQIGYWGMISAPLYDIYGSVVYFSYSDSDARSYSPEDTYLGIPHHVSVLFNTLAGCRAALGQVSFDLIGHSMGGVTALEYVRQYGFEGPQVGWVRNVITLDSPINGLTRLSTDYAEQNLPWELLHSQSAIDMASMAENREARIVSNQQLVESLRQLGLTIWTLTSLNDQAVLAGDAIIPGAGFYYNLGNGMPNGFDPGFLVGHSQILHSAEVAQDIAQIVSQYDVVQPETSTQQITCAGTIPTQISVGMGGMVSFTDGTPTRLRAQPSTSSDILNQMAEGTEFDVIGGPVCAEGYTWWNVVTYDGLNGWAAEGSGDQYYIWPYPAPSSSISTETVDINQSTTDAVTTCGSEVFSGQTYQGNAGISNFGGCEDGPAWHIYLNAGDSLNVCAMTQSPRGFSVTIQVRNGDNLLTEEYPIYLGEDWSGTFARLDAAPASGDYQLYFYATSSDGTYDFSVDINDATGVCIY